MTETTQPTLTQRLTRLLPLVVSAGLLTAIALHFDDWSLFSRVDPTLFAMAAAAALLLDSGVGALKWWWILRRLGQPLPLKTVWRMWTGLLPLTFFAPLQSGHLLYPLALVRGAGVPTAAAVESVIYDKLLSLVSTFALIAIGQLLLLPASHPLAHPLILIGALVPVCLWWFDGPLLAAVRRLGGRFSGLVAHSQLAKQPLTARDKAGLLLTGMVYQCSDSLSVWLGALALGLDLSPALAFGAFPLALLASYIPVTLSGFGIREPMTALVLGSSLTFSEGLAAGGLVDVLEYVLPAIFGLVCLPALLRAMATRRS
ncbi:MAG: flippase-like domain-containing protein [Myxococcales bacterium]|nr:flippase-like domain-containing protein [Myxococcales bacterium]